MNYNRRLYILSDEIKKRFCESKIYVFGTGVDALELFKDVRDSVEIEAYVDNKRGGTLFNEKDVLTQDCLNEKYDGKSVVIIATYRFAHEIMEGINKNIWIPGENCFIWDEDCIFHMDDNTKKFIDFNKKVWGDYKKEKKEGIILVPYDNVHSSSPIVYAYFANRMAEKYDAEIWGISSRGGEEKNESEIVKEIFRSFNVTKFISPSLDNRELSETKRLTEEIWANIFEWSDWINIKVFGIEMGTSVVRYINRFHIFDLDARTEHNKGLLEECISIIFSIKKIFDEYNIKLIFLRDAVCWENFIREIAVSNNVPAYVLQQEEYYRKVDHDFCVEPYVIYYKKFWNELTEEEKKYGLKWARERLDARLHGNTKDIPYMNNNSTFSVKKRNQRVLKDTENIKVLICPHIFGEDSYVCGKQIFDNNYIEWLDHLGWLSERKEEYDWYIKMHPNSEYRDYVIIQKLLKKYRRIQLIDTYVSPWQLKEEGLDYALTVYGTVAHEYAALGIQIVNAGINPHISFDFSFTPSTKEEYDDILLNLDKFEKNIEYEEILKYYAIDYLYYRKIDFKFSNELLWDPIMYDLSVIEQSKYKKRGTWMYDLYLKKWTKEKHDKTSEIIDMIVTEMDERRDNKFYKRDF